MSAPSGVSARSAGPSPVRLAGVFAHPDDDVFLLGGTLARHADRLETTLVFCTSGGAGPIWDPSLATRETLADVREAEQAASLRALSVTADVRFLRHPDHHLPEVPLERLVGEIAAILREARPHVVVTFGDDGITGHHDHVRAGAATTEAFHRCREEAAPGAFARLYHAALARSDVDRFYDGLRRGGHDAAGPEGSLLNLAGVPDERLALAVDARPVLERKLAAIAAHRTQRGELERIPGPLRGIVLDRECFVRAWPERVDASQAAATDLFADLDER